MGTFLRYVIYIILIIVLYLVGKGIYEGAINEQTTVGEVVNQIGEGSKQMAKESVEAIDNAVNKVDQKAE